MILIHSFSPLAQDTFAQGCCQPRAGLSQGKAAGKGRGEAEAGSRSSPTKPCQQHWRHQKLLKKKKKKEIKKKSFNTSGLSFLCTSLQLLCLPGRFPCPRTGKCELFLPPVKVGSGCTLDLGESRPIEALPILSSGNRDEQGHPERPGGMK